jgi:hypothetical protein
MIALLFAVTWLQQAACTPEAVGLLKAADQSARVLDLAGAVERASIAAREGCTDAVIESWYLKGLVAARDAYRDGGSPESLAPVRQAISALAQIASLAGASGPAEIASVTLQAAAAAAQSERDAMAVFLDFALRAEALQFAAAQPGAPAISAHEVAGDLWLQVHRYEDARRAYQEAARRGGETPRVQLGLARVAARLDQTAVACDRYRAARAIFAAERPESPEALEAQRYLDNPRCVTRQAPLSR